MERIQRQADQWFNKTYQQLRNMRIDLTSIAMTIGYPFLPTVAFLVGLSEGLQITMRQLAPVPPLPPVYPLPVPPAAVPIPTAAAFR